MVISNCFRCKKYLLVNGCIMASSSTEEIEVLVFFEIL